MADAEIFRIVPKPESCINHDAVEMLERTLAQARSGDVVGIAVIRIFADGKTQSERTNGSYHLMHSAAARLANALAREE